MAWIEPLRQDMIVLDVACGAAHGAESVAPAVRQLLQEGNAESLPFVDESFDVVFCRSSLHHFGDPHQAVAEMVRVCRRGGRVVLLDLVAPDVDSRDLFDRVHRLVDPSHRRSFLEHEVAQLLPGGVDDLVYGDTSTYRLPIDVAFTEQSDRAGAIDVLRAELRGEGPVTGFDPAEEDGSLVVSFTTCVVQAERR